ncbi:unnamed protein product [Dovyalis caffra]|uniref:Reverse transcriptase n=1 Tax=Dovyalis caffra TaxID=77055 RepID=A0AAV1STT6_9ROSI|nr:unnamed protein product [Dovyalis caffra]
MELVNVPIFEDAIKRCAFLWVRDKRVALESLSLWVASTGVTKPACLTKYYSKVIKARCGLRQSPYNKSIIWNFFQGNVLEKCDVEAMLKVLWTFNIHQFLAIHGAPEG